MPCDAYTVGTRARQRYATALSADGWASLAPHLPAPQGGGRLRLHTVREMMNAMFYRLRRGCAWRRLPPELPPWKTVYHDFRLWRVTGVGARTHTALWAGVRSKAGRKPQPSAALLASQAVNTTGVGGVRGEDGAKQRSGRKRHLLVDTPGRVLRAVGHRAASQDRAAVPGVLAGRHADVPQVEPVWGDQGSTGSGKEWIEAQLGWRVEVVRHPPKPRGVWAPIEAIIDGAALMPRGLRGVRPRRWGIARTFSWCGQSRRLSKDDERRCTTSAALISVTMVRLMRRHLAHA